MVPATVLDLDAGSLRTLILEMKAGSFLFLTTATSSNTTMRMTDQATCTVAELVVREVNL